MGSSVNCVNSRIAYRHWRSGTFAPRQNITKFSKLLAVDLDPRQRLFLMRLRIEEEDQFGLGLEQLKVAEKHLAVCQHHIMVLRGLIDFLDKNGYEVRRENVLLEALTALEATFRTYRKRILDQIYVRPPSSKH